ncbi:methanogenesis marker 17 protein [ANME-1 cluster archaeon ex4572_4]|nr:MAG: methanogenesis marker 17 protein [ANME-1 cluster archaeon ex4572_4]
MEVKVEGGDEFANASYEKLCNLICRDIGVKGNIDRLQMFCNAAEHIFILSVKIGRVGSPVKVRDVTQREGKKLRITNEKYAPELLALLWDKYGKGKEEGEGDGERGGERVRQISRLEVGFELKEEEVAELMELVVSDPRDDLTFKILDGIDRILPEGARVRHPVSTAHGVTILASENPIKEEWRATAEKIAQEMEGVNENV